MKRQEIIKNLRRKNLIYKNPGFFEKSGFYNKLYTFYLTIS